MGLAVLAAATVFALAAAAAVEAAAAQVGPQGLLPLQSHPAAAQRHPVRPADLLGPWHQLQLLLLLHEQWPAPQAQQQQQLTPQ
jgi:hypothetical protein